MSDRPRTPNSASSTPSRALRRPGAGSIIILAAVAFGVGMLTPTVNRLIEQQVHIAELQQDIENAEQQTMALETEQSRWSDPAYVRSQARGRLLFVNPGDTSYIVLDSDKASATRAPIEVSTEQHTTNTDSNALYLDSLIRAASADTDASAETATDKEQP